MVCNQSELPFRETRIITIYVRLLITTNNIVRRLSSFHDQLLMSSRRFSWLLPTIKLCMKPTRKMFSSEKLRLYLFIFQVIKNIINLRS